MSDLQNSEFHCVVLVRGLVPQSFMARRLHYSPKFTSVCSTTCAGFTVLNVYSAGGGEGYTQLVCSDDVEHNRDTFCTPTLVTVKMDTPLHVHTDDGVDRYTPEVHSAGGEGYTLHVHFAGTVDGYTLQVHIE